MLEEYRFSVPLHETVGRKSVFLWHTIGIYHKTPYFSGDKKIVLGISAIRFVVKNYKKWKTFTINEIIIFTLSINIICKE